MTGPGEGYVTVAEVAEAAGASRRAVFYWISHGWLPAQRFGPGQRLIRIREDDAAEIMSAAGFLSVAEVCAKSRSTRTTVLCWIRCGQLPAVRLPSGVYRVHPDDAEMFARRRRAPNRPRATAATGPP